MKNYHLIGIGGVGMSGLAQALLHEGISVSGSDRSYDNGENLELFNKLGSLGIRIFPQDGSGVRRGIKKIIISRAIEEDNPDLIAAKKLKIPIVYRQDELKRIFRKHSGIAVAGTSGKTTVVGMLGCIFDAVGHDITIINGGIIKNYITDKDIGNVRIGRFPYLCIETDESEGDLKGYKPEVGVIINIGLDHMSYEKNIKVYGDFARETKGALVVNRDIEIDHKNKVNFSINKARDIELFPFTSTFKLGRQRFRLKLPGLHNICNALAAITVAEIWGISLEIVAAGLLEFKGIKRRFELVSKKNGINVIDDYAHNPDKIKAALKTAHLGNGRVIAVYQPHGFGPLKMFFKELVKKFTDNLNRRDILFIPSVYYAGGTVKKDISSEDLARALKIKHIPEREKIAKKIREIAKPGDTILVMGARDTTLSDWAKGIFGEGIL